MPHTDVACVATWRYQPVKFDAGLAFMFETTYMLKVTSYAMSVAHLEKDYVDCWAGLPKMFKGLEVTKGEEEGE
eukprot:21599-Eustigmatos_ZCMA.PRE.1